MSGSAEIRHELAQMLAELESSRLEVVLVPSRRFVNHCGCVRVAISRNVKWYRSYCAAHTSNRRRRNAASDTRIKRAETIRILSRMISGTTASGYAPVLITIASRRLRHAAQPHAFACGF